jgi:hypothetical protein
LTDKSLCPSAPHSWPDPQVIGISGGTVEQRNIQYKVGDDAKSGIETVKGTVTDVAGKAQTAAGEAGGTVRDAAIETAKQVGDAATKTYRQGQRAGEYVSQNTAEQPLLALLIAGAIGYGIAYLIHAHK